jgi:hypothetical protein
MNPLRSKTTFFTPALSARSATARADRFRGGFVAGALERRRQSFSTVPAHASVVPFSSLMIWAVDVLEAAEDRQARALGGSERLLADVVLAPRTAHRLLLSLGGHDQPFPPTALPCFRTTTSLSYRIPLPL